MRRTVFRFSAALIACVGLVACTPDSPVTLIEAPNAAPAQAAQDALTLAITPAAGTAGAPISTEIGITVEHGTVSSVSVVRAGTNESIAGELRDDGTAWVPAAPLAFGATYEATVTATGKDDQNRPRRPPSPPWAVPAG